MMRKFRAALVTGAVVGAVALTATASAGAATVYNGGTFSASAPASRFVISGSSSTIVVNCLATSGSVTMNNGAYVPPADIGSFTPSFSLCTGPLGLTATVSCGFAGLLRVTGNPTSGITPASINSLRCQLTYPFIACNGTISGSASATYENPAFSVNGKLKVLTWGQVMTTSASTCSPALLPNGASVAFGGQGVSSTAVNDLTFGISSSGPVIL